MAEVHPAVFVDDDNREIMIEDPAPLRSAQLFKFISDAVWSQRPEKWRLSAFNIHSDLPPKTALSEANYVVGGIDERLVLAGGYRDLKLNDPRDGIVSVAAQTLLTPEAVSVETFCWDNGYDGRLIRENDQYQYAKFTDGHHDYARELSAGFHFEVDSSSLVISYVMQRYQYQQGKTISLSSSVWYSDFAETGYEGNALETVELSEAQETEMLTVIAKIGGISLEGFES